MNDPGKPATRPEPVLQLAKGLPFNSIRVVLKRIRVQDPVLRVRVENAMPFRSSAPRYGIRESVVKHAREYAIQLTGRQVHVSRTGNSGTGTLTIEAEYSIPVSLPGYSTTLEFHPSSSNKGLY